MNNCCCLIINSVKTELIDSVVHLRNICNSSDSTNNYTPIKSILDFQTSKKEYFDFIFIFAKPALVPWLVYFCLYCLLSIVANAFNRHTQLRVSLNSLVVQISRTSKTPIIEVFQEVWFSVHVRHYLHAVSAAGVRIPSILQIFRLALRRC